MPGPYVFHKQVHVEIGFASHFFADRDQDLEEPWPPVHSSTMHQKFRGDYRRGKESGGRVEHTKSRLFANVRDMSEVPGNEIVDLVKRGKGDVESIGKIFPVKDPAGDIAVGQHRRFVRHFDGCEGFDQFQVTRAMRLFKALKFASDQSRYENVVLPELVLKPADGHITP